ncbi:AraC family transcriptional regulator [Muricauda sp. 2012CJ35-5]|uniref:AraC family transcriptional regulator n=1 Tax=Flagellimonas spongiicola TaxID=2942208 RepID=A0ABT0PT63_9FLAO|nr:AraC family transcriptional regulator [Allomuricauda spongiicola]MCL6274549.1 AraC family transcriptional regulator [Allomuricauda spongiicola]
MPSLIWYFYRVFFELIPLVLLTIFTGIAIACGLFLIGYVFLIRKDNQTSDILLGLLFIAVVLRLSKSLFAFVFSVNSLTGISFGLLGAMTIAPLLLLYFESNRKGFVKFSYWHYLHFVVPILAFALLISDNIGARHSYFFGHRLFGVYLIWIGFNYIIRNRSRFSFTSWHRQLYFCVVGLWLLFSYQMWFDGAFNYGLGIVGASVILYYLFFMVVKSPKSLLRNGSTEVPPDLVAKVKNSFEIEKIYLKRGITVAEFAASLGAPNYLVSKAINVAYHKGFKDVVNGYRVKDVSTKLLDPDFADDKIENLAYDVGFNTVSVFYTAFKKETSMAPRDFQKAHGLK